MQGGPVERHPWGAEGSKQLIDERSGLTFDERRTPAAAASTLGGGAFLRPDPGDGHVGPEGTLLRLVEPLGLQAIGELRLQCSRFVAGRIDGEEARAAP